MSKAAELAKMGEVITNSQIGGRRNLVINGAMQVAQRGTVTAVANNEYTLDRFAFTHSQDGAFTVTQDSSAPDGFGNSLKLDVTTVDDSLSASQYLIMEHKIEAQNLQQLQFGKSGAKNITLSFYVKSNKTGTYGVNIIQSDNSSKIANLTYTINSADTWEQKSLTFTGDTSGAINDDNGIGLKLGFTLAVGSTWTSGNTSASFRAFANGNYGGGHAVNILDNTSNEWYITGIQMEVGSQATPFEHASSFGEEEELCKRYFVKHKAFSPYDRFALGMATTTDDVAYLFKFYPALRTVPTLTTGTLSHLAATNRTDGAVAIDTALTIDTNTDGPLSAIVKAPDVNGNPLTNGEASHLIANNNVAAFVAFDAEL